MNQELDDLPLPTAKAIDVQAFVPEDRLDATRYGKPYCLQGDGAVATKLYVLLREALKRSDKIAIAKFAWHNRERLGALRVVGDDIVLQIMHWDDEIRSAEGVAPKRVEISDAEVEEAMPPMDAIGGTDICQYRDQYREDMEAVIEAKAEGHAPAEMEAPAEPKGKVVDLMSALQDSVRAAKQARGGEGGEGKVREIRLKKKAPTEMAPAKKCPAS
ncbi:Ku protein [Streptomyces sp. 11-1-2]|uniref:non-homologous end joining protein Ku n=1 Tax=unclassified Streptomyces TaxID=2593676 RepID=UPI001F089092|nr:Ku protein [Streptomyces sp. 11-1-2]